jgi:putative endonuclease
MSLWHDFHVKTFTSKSQRTGEIGETIVCRHLIRQGFAIIERNFTRKWGEIDIVAQKGIIFHFIEVKAVTRENDQLQSGYGRWNEWRPEDQVHGLKQRRLIRIIETYMAGGEVDEWQFDVACVYIDFEGKKARIRLLPNIILV